MTEEIMNIFSIFEKQASFLGNPVCMYVYLGIIEILMNIFRSCFYSFIFRETIVDIKESG